MTDSFDAYYKWLGIPPAEQPPNHYRLLGIQLYEADLDVIDSAADARLLHLRSFQSGPRGKISQGLMNEISEARVTLLDTKLRLEYDALLQSAISANQTPEGSVGTTPSEIPAYVPDDSLRFPRSRNRKLPIVVGLVLMLALILGGVIFAKSFFGSPSVADNSNSNNENTENVAGTDSDSNNKSNSQSNVATKGDSNKIDANTNFTDGNSTDKKQSDSNNSTDSNTDNANDNDSTKSTTHETDNVSKNNQNLKGSTDDANKKTTTSDPDDTDPGNSDPNDEMTKKPEPESGSSNPLSLPSEMELDPEEEAAKRIATLARLEPLPIELPGRVYEGDEELYSNYANSTFQSRESRLEKIETLKQLAADRLQELADDQSQSPSKQKTAALAKAALKELADEDFQRFGYTKDDPDDLRDVERIYLKQLEEINDETQREISKVAKGYLDSIDDIIRELRRENAEKDEIAFLTTYQKLMEIRSSNRPLSGRFIASLAYPKTTKFSLFVNGQQVAFDNSGTSSTVRLDPQNDLLAIAYHASETDNAALLMYRTSEGLEIAFRRSNIRLTNETDLSRLSHQLIRDTTTTAFAPNTRRRNALPNPGNAQWFAAYPDQPTIFGLELSRNMVQSPIADLTRLSDEFDSIPEDQEVVRIDRNKKVLLVGEKIEELRFIESICDRFALETESVETFADADIDFSNYHTVIGCSNSLRHFVRNEETMDDLEDDFTSLGGHLMFFGSWNAEGAEEALGRYGIDTGFRHGNTMVDTGKASDLFLDGSEKAIPSGRTVVSTGSIECTASWTVILDRIDGELMSDPLLVTMPLDKGRITYTQVEPWYNKSEWFAYPCINWISRGAPIPKSELDSSNSLQPLDDFGLPDENEKMTGLKKFPFERPLPSSEKPTESKSDEATEKRAVDEESEASSTEKPLRPTRNQPTRNKDVEESPELGGGAFSIPSGKQT